MGTITIQHRTTIDPITCIGEEAGVCWGADTTNQEGNYQRGIECLKSNHGRTWEFPTVYAVIDGYSARVIRELYTHIGGSPTRVQASTRYIDYKSFPYIVPETIANDEIAAIEYADLMERISATMSNLEKRKIPREDIGMCLPLGMETRMVLKANARTLSDMSRQRLCTRAYWEYRELFKDLSDALSEYSPEWKTFVQMEFKPKCEVCGFCTERYSCGRKPKKSEVFNDENPA